MCKPESDGMYMLLETMLTKIGKRLKVRIKGVNQRKSRTWMQPLN